MKPFDNQSSCCFLQPAKRILILFLAVLFSYQSFGQTINGVVNTYHKVLEVIPAKACLRVTNVGALNVNTMVMVVQMKGASMQLGTASNYGDTIALGSAGNYEIGTICYIIGDSVFLFHNLLNSYDPVGKVQLVQFAEFNSVTVTDTVKAQSWDSAAGTGGVIAIYAEQDLTLNAPIYADSSGNAGGIWYPNSGTCGFFEQVGTLFAYDITATNQDNGAYKGEGVANIPSTLNSAKGAPTNGGGGGNNHNNSGGGGANLKTGGNGGGNNSPGPFGCNTGNNWGRGGKALSSWGATKIFMGGGAGAGHANNGAINFNYGGNGGGIIFIWANNLIGNGQSIRANGGKGGDSQGDGAGGGGAAGTIIMNVTNYTGSATVTANGGKGGDSYDDNSIVRCFGGGGGGSGGAIYYSGAAPGGVTTQVAGGVAGLQFNSNTGCNAPVPPSAGTTGDIIPNYTFRRSTNPAGYCQLLLPSKLLYFQGQLSGNAISLNWEVEHQDLINYFIIEKKQGNNWVEIANVTADPSRYKYSTIDATPSLGNNFYRLRVIDNDGSHYYSPIRKIWNGQGFADFVIYPNPSSGKVFVRGELLNGELIKLLDISGKTIWQQVIRNSTAELMLPPLPPGVYLVQHGNQTKKLVIR
jgi:hypothetical protein